MKERQYQKEHLDAVQGLLDQQRNESGDENASKATWAQDARERKGMELADQLDQLLLQPGIGDSLQYCITPLRALRVTGPGVVAAVERVVDKTGAAATHGGCLLIWDHRQFL